MAAAPLTHADRARLAHQALRLRENGVDSLQHVRRVSDLARDEDRRLRALPDGADQTIGHVRGRHPLARIALALHDHLDEERPGPTDRGETEALMMRPSLTDVWKQWDESVTANLEETLEPAELAAWRESVARDQGAFEERVEQMLATGDWPVHPYFGHNRHLDGAANALYDFGREGFLDGTIDWDTAVIKFDLVDSADYTVNLATHQFRSSVTAAGRVASSAALANKTKTAGVADGDDFTYAAVTGDPSESLVGYQSSAVAGGADVADTAQRVICYIDTATGLPVTPNGGNINVVFDSGANRIFKL